MTDYRISKETIEGLDDADLAWAVIEPMWDDFDYSGGYKRVSEFLSSVTNGQAALISLDWCQKIIRNDGIEGFFMSGVGVLSQFALDGFRLIGAEIYADLLDKSFTFFPDKKPPASAMARAKILRKVPKHKREQLFDSLEDGFYRLLQPEEHDLEKYRASYVRNHPEDFFID
jgi:hypothetical protein